MLSEYMITVPLSLRTGYSLIEWFSLLSVGCLLFEVMVGKSNWRSLSK